MSGKRAAPYQIDQNTLEEKQVQQNSNSPDIANQNSKNTIENRKIFKIRMPGSQNIQVQSKVSFKLHENTDQNLHAQKQKINKDQTPPTNNIFANLAKSSFNGVGLFSNISATNNFANLFTSNLNTQNSAKITANSSNLFQNKQQALSANIFKPAGQSTSIFARNKKQNSQDEEGQDSAELQKQQNIQSDPKKSIVHYQYKQTCPIVYSGKCGKFKKNTGDLISNVQVVLQKDNQTKLSFLSVKLSQTQTSIFSGILLQGRCTTRHINNKQQNVEVSLIQKQKQKFSKVILKFQFSQKEKGSFFYRQVQNLIKNCQKDQQKGQEA